MISNSAPSSPISLSDFLTLSPDQMEISVTKFSSNLFMKTTYEVMLAINSEALNLFVEIIVQKRYTEFQGFYDSLTYRYQNLNFPAFPSRFQIVNTKESRLKFFDSLMKSVVKLTEPHPEIKNEILKLLFEFVLEKNQGLEIKKISDKKLSSLAVVENQTSISSVQSSLNEKILLHVQEPEEPIAKSYLSDKRNSIHITNENSIFENIFNVKKETSKENQNEEVANKDGWQVEFQYLKNKFYRAYVKVTEQCLFLFDSILANNFFFCIPLFKISYVIYKIKKNKKTLLENSELVEALEYLISNNIKEFPLSELKCEIHVSIYHACESEELILKFNSKTTDFYDFMKLVNILESNTLAVKSQSKYISTIDETNSYIYGKLFFEFVQIDIPNFEGNIFANISLHPYTFKTKSIISSNTFQIKQMFSIPIHSRFEVMRIEIFSRTNQGLFQKKVVEEKLCEHLIKIPDVLNNYFFPNKKIIVNLENSNRNMKNITEVSIQFKLINYSSFMALVTKNRNKNVLEDMTISKSEEDISIKNLMKRLKKIIILMKEFKEYYKTLFRFKYPVYSIFMCLALVFYFMFCDINYFLSHISVFLTYFIFVHSYYFQKNIYPYADKYVFGLKNPYDFESIVVTKVDVEDDEVKKGNYLTDQKEKKNLIKAIIEPIKNFKNYKNTYFQVLFKFTNFVSILEKMKNLFLWTDPLLTFYFFIMMICLATLIYAVKFKYLMLMSILTKFFSGATFYKRKYINNIEIANIVLKYCHDEWYNETKNKLKNSQNHSNENKLNTPTNANNSGRKSSFTFLKKKETKKNKEEDYKNLDNITVFDDKFKMFIKEQLEKHADILIKIEFLNSVTKMAEIKEAVSKSKTLLKIKKESPLYTQTRNNSNIYKRPVDIELVFLYFVQNIKSDYYLSKHYLNNKTENSPDRSLSHLDQIAAGTNNYNSVSSLDLNQATTSK